jgi:spermidine synthase
VEEAGTVAGRLYAVSTAGSLVGTLTSALLFIPLVGTRRTFLIFALAISVVAVLGLRPVRRYAVAPALIAALIVLPVGTLKAKSDIGRVVFESETEYQYARVVQSHDGTRYLELNEGIAQHSIYKPRSRLVGNYWDDVLVLPFAGRDAPPRSFAILGNAAGTTASALGEFFPHTQVDAVELDPELGKIGRRWFHMDNPRMRLHNEDARPWLRRSDDRYDAILVDAYRQPYIPFYVATKEFFELVRDHLTPGGTMIINIGHPEGEQALEKVLSATIGDVFPHVLRDRVNGENSLVVASRSPLSPGRLRTATLPAPLRRIGTRVAERLAAPLPGGDVYTDDKAPVEWLIDKSIIDYAANGD